MRDIHAASGTRCAAAGEKTLMQVSKLHPSPLAAGLSQTMPVTPSPGAYGADLSPMGRGDRVHCTVGGSIYQSGLGRSLSSIEVPQGS